MKRFLSIALAAVMIIATLALTACGSSGSADLSNSKYVGTWKMASVSALDEEGQLEGDYTLVLNADGTGTFTDGEEEASFTWEESSEGFKTKGDFKATFTEDGDMVSTKIVGVTMNFEKQ